MVRRLRVWLLFVVLLWLGTTTYANSIKLRVTNYNVSVKQCGNTKGITASGHKVRVGVCAGDWRIYPPGTILKLDNKELLVVADTGRKVKGKYHIDRYNPNKRVFSITSRGIIVSRGDRDWRKKSNGAFLAVKTALQLRNKLIKKDKIYNDRKLRNYREWQRFRNNRSIRVFTEIQMGKSRSASSFDGSANKAW